MVSSIDDSDALAENMMRVMQDKFLCRALTREGYEAYQSQFTIKKVIKSYDSLYKSLKNLT